MVKELIESPISILSVLLLSISLEKVRCRCRGLPPRAVGAPTSRNQARQIVLCLDLNVAPFFYCL